MKKDAFEQETELQRDPFARAGLVTRAHPTLRWRDASGEHSHAIATQARVGSAPGVEILLTDRTVSRLHAELTVLDDGLWLHDLGSKNGSFIGDVRVNSARVPDAATLRFGGAEVSVRYGKAPLPVELWAEPKFGDLVGQSQPMRELFHKLSRLAPLTDAVLLEGETGTGKEVVARALHDASPRADKPFIVVDCGALPEDLLEAELFGYSRGAFTGAERDHDGAVVAADGGTLFLDEIGELPLAVQPKLLRLLESKTVRPLGSTVHRPVDVRFVAATHRNLGALVNTGAFREDLYFRLAIFPLTIPPLRERPEDIALLMARFLPAGATPPLPSDFLQQLRDRPWPGNVRELRNVVHRAMAFGVDAALAGATGQPPGAPGGAPPTSGEDLLFSEARERAIAEFEARYVHDLLVRHDHNVSAAAKAAGVNRSYLHKVIRKHGL